MDTSLFLQAQEQARYCQVFSNPTRILILWVLGTEEKTVSAIASEVGASIQNTSQHLRLMKDRGILNSRREGQAIFYRVVDNDCLIDKKSISMQTLKQEQKK